MLVSSLLAVTFPLILHSGDTFALAMPRAVNDTQLAFDSGAALTGLHKEAYDKVLARLATNNGSQECTRDNVRVRREWRNMPARDRIAFSDAVTCLQQKPSLYTGIPGAKSIFDDFVALHQELTGYVHMSATFLLWHRYYIWTYERRLASECGYSGTLPYWEWGLDIENPAASPVFDGSATSMGSDGAPVPHEGLVLPGSFDNHTIVLPPGTGGGCVTTGPFANMTVHLGPQAMPDYGATAANNSATPTADNPRCLRRDLNGYPLRRWASFRNTTTLIRDSGNIEIFQAVAQGDSRYVGPGQLGVHGGGHYAIGGDPGSDVYISPGDTAFYLHHAQLDRVYWIWQNLDWENRQNIFGTNTTGNIPPSAEVKLDDVLQVGPLGVEISIRRVMDTVDGPFCYVYALD